MLIKKTLFYHSERSRRILLYLLKISHHSYFILPKSIFNQQTYLTIVCDNLFVRDDKSNGCLDVSENIQ